MNLLDPNFDAVSAAQGAELWVSVHDAEPQKGYWYEATVARDPENAVPGHRFYFGDGLWSYHTELDLEDSREHVQRKYGQRRYDKPVKWWRGQPIAQIAGIPSIPSRS